MSDTTHEAPIRSLEARAAPEARLAEFLLFSEQIREEGGATIRLGTT
jgi:hypothetical protein